MTTKAGVIKRANRKNLKVLTKLQLIDFFKNIQLIKTLKHQALFLFLYLTGSRIEEVVGMKEVDEQDKVKWAIEPVKRSQVILKKDDTGRDILFIDNLVILKRKADGMGRPTRTLNLPCQPEQEFMKPLLVYLSSLESDDYLWDYHPGYAWDLAKKYFGNNWFPHFFRHTRATRLATDYGFNSLELATFMGWKDPRMASRYAHLATEDLAKKIK